MNRFLFYLIVTISVTLPSFYGKGAENEHNIDKNIAHVDELYAADNETIPELEILELSRKVIKNREFYNNNTLAKMFSLLATLATNKGDVAKALQFALDGQNLSGVDERLRLILQLKVSIGYYESGKSDQAQKIIMRAVNLAEKIGEPKLLIKALSYRAMAYALTNQHELALADLTQVYDLLDNNQELSERISLLDVLANTYYFLGSYKTAVTLFNKVLKLRYELSTNNNIEQTYYNLAKSYLKLEQLDDAYNAFWQAKEYAEASSAPIKIAFAQLGLGQVLFKQNKLIKARNLLKKAEQNFNQQHFPHPQLTSLISLAKVSLSMNDSKSGYQYIKQAQKIAQHVELTDEQIDVYLLAGNMYQVQQKYRQALAAMVKYIELFSQSKLNRQYNVDMQDPNIIASEKSKKISLNMAEEADLKSRFNQKFDNQKKIIDVLSIVILVLFLWSVFLVLRMRANKLNLKYDEVETPNDHMASPSQTKGFYQHHYKKARKFDYPLAVGYFAIENWQELEFQYSQKIVNEVARTIATLVNDFCDEFDRVGLINRGEYLFLAPHQKPEHLQEIFERLSSSLKVQFFANLGEFSIKVRYDSQAPNIQDIDPYIFLSRLSESIRSEYSSYTK